MKTITKKRVLVVDVGGSHVKIRVSTGQEVRQAISGPTMTARRMVALVHKLAGAWQYEVVSIGYPGVVMHGCIVAEPHNLGQGWVGFDFHKAFGRPTRIINDATMQAIGSYDGGRMLFLGLGTGLGSALIVDGVAESMELAHLQFKKGRTFEDYVGDAGRQRRGNKKWRLSVTQVVNQLRLALEADYVVLGGGNSRKLKRLPDLARLGSNDFAFIGGFRLWSDTWMSKRHAGPRAAD